VPSGPGFFVEPFLRVLTRIYRPTLTNIARLAASIRAGKLVAVPSETVYGLAADATNPIACGDIFRAKRRPHRDPLIVHVASIEQAKRIATWNSLAQELALAFWPGPLTLVLPRKGDSIPDIVTSGRSSLAVRMPDSAIFQKLILEAKRPLAAPSANPFGYISPTSPQHVKQSLNGLIPAIIDGGKCKVGVESTIVDLTNPDRPAILRPGGISRDEIACRLPQISLSQPRPIEKSTTSLPAPGLLDYHYSPRTETFVHKTIKPFADPLVAWVLFSHRELPSNTRVPNVYVLSPNRAGAEAARRLYAILRELDGQNLKAIHLEKIPTNDPWSEAINDRMTRAANQGRPD